MISKDILALLGIGGEGFYVHKDAQETDAAIYIDVDVDPNYQRQCPHCKSANCAVKDTRTQKIKHSVIRGVEKPVFVMLNKRIFVCKACGKSHTQTVDFFVRKGANVSNDVCWFIERKTREIVSFSAIGRELNLPAQTVINVFNKMVTAEPKPLSYGIAIDEKGFETEGSKYACIISNSMTGEVIDVLKGRTAGHLGEYFSGKSADELAKVKFFSSDMFTGYRAIKSKYFPKAIHIIDPFHITRLFTDCIQRLRKRYMAELPTPTKEYKFIKAHWKLFLVNPFSDKFEKLKWRKFYGEDGSEVDVMGKIVEVTRKAPFLLEVYNLYSDFCKFVSSGYYKDRLDENLVWIIDRARNSICREIRTVGATMEEFIEEIYNAYGKANVHSITNAIAESNNAAIDQIIRVSQGCRDFDTFRKRVLHVKSGRKK